jgi:hypothetical protein
VKRVEYLSENDLKRLCEYVRAHLGALCRTAGCAQATAQPERAATGRVGKGANAGGVQRAAGLCARHSLWRYPRAIPRSAASV